MNLEKWELELKKRIEYPYIWGMKQNNFMDRLTDFIHHTYSFEMLQEIIEKKFSATSNYDVLKNYSLNRWFNFWSAKAVEQIFTSHSRVTKENNEYHKTIDFYIDGIPFDHKTSIYPKSFKESIFDVKRELLIQWLYDNQSRERRYHFENRIFLILHKPNEEHWKLKAEVDWLKYQIYDYLNNFDLEKTYKLKNNEGREISSDIIWGYQLY
jgi:hypothetical protein